MSPFSKRPVSPSRRVLTAADIEEGDPGLLMASSANAGSVRSAQFSVDIGGPTNKLGFIKRAEGKMNAPAYKSGITVGRWPGADGDVRDVHLAARAVASSAVDRLLETHVLADSYFIDLPLEKPRERRKYLLPKERPLWGVKTEPWPEESAIEDKGGMRYVSKGKRKSEIGHVSAQAYGRAFSHNEDFVDTSLAAPEIQRGLSNLQVVDWLTAQIDRHPGNIFIDEDGRVTGIDNDLSFGTTQYLRVRGENIGHNVHLPERVDARTAARIRSVTEEQFKDELRNVSAGDGEKLTKKEIFGAGIRYRWLQNHLDEHPEAIVSEWNEATYAATVAPLEAVRAGAAAGGNPIEDVKRQGGSILRFLEIAREFAPAPAAVAAAAAEAPPPAVAPAAAGPPAPVAAADAAEPAARWPSPHRSAERAGVRPGMHRPLPFPLSEP